MTEGDYDAYETARPVVERLYQLGTEASEAPPRSARFDELKAEILRLLSEDLEHVTRIGVVRGTEKFVADWEVQLRTFTVAADIETFDGGNSVVVLSKMRRQSREDPKDYLTVNSGAIYRVRNGRIVFMEGYPDGRDALRAAGLAENGS